MSGPPPTPMHLRRLRGNPGKRALHPEPQPTIPEKCPEPPPFLNGFARDEWWLVAPSLHQLGLLSRIDVPSLAAYCYAYAQWRQAAESLAAMADRDPTTHGLLIRTMDGNARRNPLVKIAADAAADMVRFASEFGLTPIARARLGAAGYGPPSESKFDGLIGGGTILPMRRGDE